MSAGNAPKMSYASMAGGGSTSKPPQPSQPTSSSQNVHTSRTQTSHPHPINATGPNHTSPHHAPHQRHPSQTPPTRPGKSHPENAFYILTLRTTSRLEKAITSLRDKHFPPKLNKLSAHIALFRALPGSEMPQIERDIKDLCEKTKVYEVGCREGDMFLMGRAKQLLQNRANGVSSQQNTSEGRHVNSSSQNPHDQQNNGFPPSGGVALTLSHNLPMTRNLHRNLLTPWRSAGFLSQQDQGGFKPHYTIQNKENEAARIEICVEEVEAWLKDGGEGTSGWATGLEMWRYERGWWVWVDKWFFDGAKAVEDEDEEASGVGGGEQR